MHEIKWLPGLEERIVARRSDRNVFKNIVAQRAALIVVDMQNFFCAPDNEAARHARDIVPNINRIASALRNSGGVIVWLITTFSNETANSWSTFFEGFLSPALRKATLTGLAVGAEGHTLWPGMEPKPGDLHVEKNRFSPFIEGASDLHKILQDLEVDTLLITGTVTNVCCELPARDASMLNYKTIMIADGNAAQTDEHHNATLSNVYGFIDVQFADQVIDSLI